METNADPQHWFLDNLEIVEMLDKEFGFCWRLMDPWKTLTHSK
jgi:hypothetical protein